MLAYPSHIGYLCLALGSADLNGLCLFALFGRG